MHGKMNNCKWREVFDLLGALEHEISIRVRGVSGSRRVRVGDVGEDCLFAYDFPGNKIHYKDILGIALPCEPDLAAELEGLGQMESRYQNGVFTIAGY